MSETVEVLRRRLAMRSMRRGIKEMDLILSDFAGRRLEEMGPEALAEYDALLAENDHDLFAWINGQATPPARFAPLVAEIASGAQGIVRPE
jgi:antitoxin CptB